MALDYCTSCQTIEGKWRPITKQEYIDVMGSDFGFIEEKDQALEDHVCEECGDVGCHKGIAEHDDYGDIV